MIVREIPGNFNGGTKGERVVERNKESNVQLHLNQELPLQPISVCAYNQENLISW